MKYKTKKETYFILLLTQYVASENTFSAIYVPLCSVKTLFSAIYIHVVSNNMYITYEVYNGAKVSQQAYVKIYISATKMS